LCALRTAAAQGTPEQFYHGRIVNLVIGAHVGGANDSYARLLARHIARYIPGNPTIVPQNMPGAGGNKAAGYLALQAPKDGSVIGAVETTPILQPLLSEQPMAHDPSKFIYVGNANSDVYLCFVRADAPVQSFREALSKELILGATADDGKVRGLTAILDNLLGAKLRIVAGYAGTRDVTIAIERDEVQGMCGLGWTSLSTQHPDWIARGFVRVLVQEDMKGMPDLNRQGVPLAAEFAKTKEDRQVMELIFSQGVFGRPYVLPPGTPPDRAAALRAAFTDTLQDKDFLADARRNHLDIEPMTGENLQAMVTRLYALPPAIVTRARQSLIYRPPSG
jgi:tripartite-type tricarboxylate transporter receptor subunit TctC